MRRVARPSPSWLSAPSERGSVGSSTSVSNGDAICSPTRSAKGEVPFSTDSPFSVPATTPITVAAIRGSSTSVTVPLGGCPAPSMRVARSAASSAASSRSTSAGSRPTDTPCPEVVSPPSSASACTDRWQNVDRPVTAMPVEVATAAAPDPSPHWATRTPTMRGPRSRTARSSRSARTSLRSAVFALGATVADGPATRNSARASAAVNPLRSVRAPPSNSQPPPLPGVAYTGTPAAARASRSRRAVLTDTSSSVANFRADVRP